MSDKHMLSANEYASKIFKSKNKFHKEQASLPIEKKVEILIELQKLIVQFKPVSDDGTRYTVWQI